MYYAIALESILVGADEKTDITYKLSIRCSPLLSDNFEKRSKIKKRISDLYAIRSAIVHRGNIDFTDTDLNDMRNITQNALVALTVREEFKDFSQKQELNAWFEAKVLM